MATTSHQKAAKAPQDLLGLDMGTSGVKVVRVRRSRDGLTIQAADILPAVNPRALRGEAGAKKSFLVRPFTAHYAAVACTAERAVVRVVNLPGAVESADAAERQIRENIGLEDRYRVSYIACPTERPKESRLLTVALPEEDVAGILSLFSEGRPAAVSLEVSGLAAINACANGPAKPFAGEGVCILDCGARTTVMAMLNRGVMVLARRLDVGGDPIINHVQKQLGVDYEMARSILTEGVIDVSAAVRQVMDPFLRQLTISRDYVERQENCRIGVAFLSGGMSLSPAWIQEIARATGLEVRSWNPLKNLACASGALPERLAGQESRFAAAVGAVMGATAGT